MMLEPIHEAPVRRIARRTGTARPAWNASDLERESEGAAFMGLMAGHKAVEGG